MKIIAIQILGYNTRYVSHYEALNGEAIILLTPKREEAQKFNVEPALDAQRHIRDSIARFIANDGANMLRILKDTNAVIVENEVPTKQIIVKLTKIKRIENPDEQTQGFVQRIDDWMKQWTIENNYKMMLVTDPKDALRVWCNDFHRLVSTMFASSVKNIVVANQFTLEYHVCEIKEDGSFWPSGYSRTVDMADYVFFEEEGEECGNEEAA